MKITAFNADLWKMDGGVAFGVVPKTLWTRVYPEDENNLVRIATRCLLLQTGDRNILIDTGMGNKRDKKYYAYKYRFGGEGLISPLKNANLSPTDITDIVFTHLHDDHVGGATFINEAGEVEEFFKNAQYWCSESHWEWSKSSNKREAAAYFSDNLDTLMQSGRLNLIKKEGKWMEGIEFRIFNGHTRGQLVPLIKSKDRTFAFVADFIPSKANIPLPYLPAVDIEPLLSLEEKESFLNEAFLNNYILIFQHDYYCEACSLQESEKGIIAGEEFKIHKFN